MTTLTRPAGRALLAVSVVAASLLGLQAGHAAQAPGEQVEQVRPGSIAGRVVSARTGEPLAGAAVTLTTSELARRRRSTTTDADGVYRFDGLPPALYEIDVRAEGFLHTSFGNHLRPDRGNPVELRPDEAVRGADFALPEPGVISGFVFDEFGDPVPDIVVRAFTPEFVLGEYLLTAAGASRTDDRGWYRVDGLSPGPYYIGGVTGAFAGPDETGGFAVTYFPGTTDAAAAQEVRVEASAEVGNLSFAMVPTELRRVSGIVVDASGAPVPGVMVLLGPASLAGGAAWLTARGMTAGDGSFEVRNVPPGTYEAQAFGQGGGNTMGSSPFGSAVIAGVDVVLRDDAATLIGQVRDRQGQTTDQFEVLIMASDPSRWTYPSRFLHRVRSTQAGGFRAPGITPGDYIVVAVTALDPVRWEDPDYLMELRGLGMPVTLGPRQELGVSLDIMR